ncbi:MAG: glutathione S-transferase N-terminal domain-containing protein [Acidobacteria bacterium]|nr:glutathione S-transferase N-terminal domain-containing protein [Acidobacteriota bacterium]
MSEVELYGTATCTFTRDAREALRWKRRAFVEYDVDLDPAALERLVSLTGQRAVPVLVENGRVVEVGWQGRCCFIGVVVSGDRDDVDRR